MNTTQLKIDFVKREVKQSTKTGKPFTSLSIKSGNDWYSGFGNQENANWKNGDVVDVIVSSKEWQGKTYLNFEMPQAAAKKEVAQQGTMLVGGLAQVLALCTEMNERLKNIEGKVLPVAVNSTHPFES